MANYPPNIAGVASISSGEGVIVNNADPNNPIVGIIAPVTATDGGTGLTSSGVDATKYLKSDGAGGWELATLAAGGLVTDVTAASPLSSSGGGTPEISLTGTVDAAHGGTGLGAPADPGDDGKVLTASGGAYILSTPAASGVTEVTAGLGLSATTNPITATGTLSVSFVGANAAASSDANGGDTTIPVGAGDGTGNGGNATIQGGVGGATGDGGTLYLRGGAGGAGGDDGSIQIGDENTKQIGLGAPSIATYMGGNACLLAADFQLLTDDTPGTTDVVNANSGKTFIATGNFTGGTLALDGTTPFNAGSYDGQLLVWIHGAGDPVTIATGGNVRFSGSSPATVTATTASVFMYSTFDSKWNQITPFNAIA